LSGKTIRLSHIRSNDDNPGLRDFEISFLKLIEKLTNGCVIEINYTGTLILYRPGTIVGGKVSHDCGRSKAIGYFLEPLVALAPFAKYPLTLRLTGITNSPTEISIDIIRTVLLPHMKYFGISLEDDALVPLELKILQRGAPPNGGGEVLFQCPVVRSLRPVQCMDEGRIKRIRGIAYATRVAPQMANRMVESARGYLNRLLPDVYIYTDVYKGSESGLSPGFALSLVTESTSGTLHAAEYTAQAGQTPEEVGELSAKLLLSEIQKGGAIASVAQPLIVLNMALSSEDVSKVRFGKLTPFTIQYLRDLKTFFGIMFKIRTDPRTKTILLTCVGTNYINSNKKVS
jgi:RNA 3'-terminal phosphate cyclase-like protein